MTKFKLPTSDMFGMVAETATNLSLGDTWPESIGSLFIAAWMVFILETTASMVAPRVASLKTWICQKKSSHLNVAKYTYLSFIIKAYTELSCNYLVEENKLKFRFLHKTLKKMDLKFIPVHSIVFVKKKIAKLYGAMSRIFRLKSFSTGQKHILLQHNQFVFKYLFSFC